MQMKTPEATCCPYRHPANEDIFGGLDAAIIRDRVHHDRARSQRRKPPRVELGQHRIKW